MNSEELTTWELLRETLETGDDQQLRAVVADLPTAEATQALLHLDQSEQKDILVALEPADAADLIEEYPEQPALDLFESLSANEAAAILGEVESDVQADFLQEIDDDDVDAILANMEPSAAADARALAKYAPDTAGGLMHPQVFRFSTESRVADVLDRFVSGEEDFERYRGHHPYVVDPTGRLVGVISLRNLLLSPRNKQLTEIMTAPISLKASASIGQVEDIFDEEEFLGLPVVDDDGVLLGAISRSTLADELRDRADIEQLKRHGIVEDELRSMPLAVRSRRRLSWLSVNILLNIAAASVIAMYEDTLSAVIALAVFLPIVSDMSGCSGNQAVAVSMRELTLGVIEPDEFFRVWRKEAGVGAINGLALGLLLGIAAWLWKGNPYLGMVVGAALAVNTVVAVSIGGCVPLLLKYFSIDPAVASGPILTTITDMVGFFLVLSIAAMAMPLLI
jgi:magnesium transporter